MHGLWKEKRKIRGQNMIFFFLSDPEVLGSREDERNRWVLFNLHGRGGLTERDAWPERYSRFILLGLSSFCLQDLQVLTKAAYSVTLSKLIVFEAPISAVNFAFPSSFTSTPKAVYGLTSPYFKNQLVEAILFAVTTECCFTLKPGNQSIMNSNSPWTGSNSSRIYILWLNVQDWLFSRKRKKKD